MTYKGGMALFALLTRRSPTDVAPATFLAARSMFWLATLVAGAGFGLVAQAGSPSGPWREQRDFSVLVDGKPAGSYRLALEATTPGQIVAQSNVDVRVRFLFFNYAYIFRGRETWIGDRLARIEATSDDGGLRNGVQGAFAEGGSQITVNGAPRGGPVYRWTSSFWRLPEGVANDQPLSILDADTGRELKARLVFVAREDVLLGQQRIPCARYRLTGDVVADLWFDAEDRLARQITVEAGHRSELRLSAIRR